jgi:hypothetical protein
VDDIRQLNHLDPAKTVRLYNSTCVFCSRPFGKEVKRTADHIVGRRFVPRGSLNGHWNLIGLHANNAMELRVLLSRTSPRSRCNLMSWGITRTTMRS